MSDKFHFCDDFPEGYDFPFTAFTYGKTNLLTETQQNDNKIHS